MHTWYGNGALAGGLVVVRLLGIFLLHPNTLSVFFSVYGILAETAE
jgi:hypothetical protein